MSDCNCDKQDAYANCCRARSLEQMIENRNAWVGSLQARVTELEAESFEQRRDLLKQHQEDARIWQIERCRIEKENARLRKVVEAAREAMKYTDGTFAPNFPEPIAKLKNAIRELDGDKPKQHCWSASCDKE